MSKKDNIKGLTFEQAFQQLEDTVQNLEVSNLPLAEALNLYQHGMALAKHCGLELEQAELIIKKLTPAGELMDFDEAR